MKNDDMVDKETDETRKERITAPYLVDVEELRTKVQELGAKLSTADEHNQQVEFIYDSLRAGAVNDETIKAALDAQFGKPKGPRKPRAPNRQGTDPTDTERKLLSSMTMEGMTKSDIFRAAGVVPDPNSSNLLSSMQKMGWIKNAGGKGRGALWVLTDTGSKLVT